MAPASAAAAKRQGRRGSGLTSFVMKDICKFLGLEIQAHEQAHSFARAPLLVRVGEDFLGDKHRTAACDAETGFAFAAD
jgi:hypothetical protein